MIDLRLAIDVALALGFISLALRLIGLDRRLLRFLDFPVPFAERDLELVLVVIAIFERRFGTGIDGLRMTPAP